MLFNSHEFIFAFFPAMLAIFFALGRFNRDGAIFFLGLASLAFYSWDSPLRHVMVLLLSITANFVVGSHLTKPGTPPQVRKLLLIVGITGNLAAIGYYKYTGFVLDVFGIVTDPILLPLGISFFTFTQMAFLIDAYRGLAKEYNPVHYLLFVTYLPHLISGPILHHGEMMPQFRKERIFRFDPQSMVLGLSIFAIGMGKKILLADNFAPYADITFGNASTIPLTPAEAWTGALAYTLQIYFDFSGYSDMAIGLSRCIGIRLPINFNSPYKAVSIVSFWRRWHMTLSRFLRDYLYISLGGNRKGPIRRHMNLMITMLLGGLWHGAGWTFIIWGGLHGFYLIVNHFWTEFGLRLPRVIAWSATFAAVVVAWVFFRANGLDQAGAMLFSMGGGNGIPLSPILQDKLGFLTSYMPVTFDGTFQNNLFSAFDAMKMIVLGMAIALFAPNTQELFGNYDVALDMDGKSVSRFKWRPGPVWAVCLGGGLATAVLLMSGDSPFLYFRF